MDASQLSTLVPAGGLGAVLLVLVGYLLKQIPADRSDYTRSLAAERQRTAEALERADQAQQEIDQALRERRAAETAAALAETRAASQDSLLRWYAAEREHLLRLLPPPAAISDIGEPE